MTNPLIVLHDGGIYAPVFVAYPETDFGGDFATEADYRDPFVADLIEGNGGTIIWPLLRYSYDTINLDLTQPAPAPPSRDNWLGTDDQGRDVLARLIYGFRISVLFGLSLTILSSIIGVLAGAVTGVFRRLDRPWPAALHRNMDICPLAIFADYHRGSYRARVFYSARHLIAFFMGIAGRRRACGIFPRPQF